MLAGCEHANCPLAAQLPIGASMKARYEAAQKLCRCIEGESIVEDRLTDNQRRLLILRLRVFDARAMGVSWQETAETLFAGDPRHAGQDWKSSSLRRWVNRLGNEAEAFVDGGYLDLLRGSFE